MNFFQYYNRRTYYYLNDKNYEGILIFEKMHGKIGFVLPTK